MKDDDFDDFNISDFENEFDFVETEEERSFRYITPRTSKKAIFVDYQNAKKMAKELSPKILNGEKIFSLIDGAFIFGDFIEAFLVENNLLAREITISTLSLSQNNIDSLHNIIAGNYVEKLNLIVSDFYWSHNKMNHKYIMEQLDIDNKFQIAVASTHTKTTLIELESGQKLLFHGSANLKSSQNIETFIIESDEELFDFNYKWHKNILDEYAIINKSIRNKKLWETVTKK